MDGARDQVMGELRHKVRQANFHVKQTEPYSPWQNAAESSVLRDLVPSSRLSPLTATNRFGISEQLPVSQDVNNIHAFNDNNKSTSKENKDQEHPKMMQVSIANQQMDAAMESELVS